MNETKRRIFFIQPNLSPSEWPSVILAEDGMVRTPVEEGSVPLQATQLKLLVALVGVAALVLPISRPCRCRSTWHATNRVYRNWSRHLRRINNVFCIIVLLHTLLDRWWSPSLWWKGRPDPAAAGVWSSAAPRPVTPHASPPKHCWLARGWTSGASSWYHCWLSVLWQQESYTAHSSILPFPIIANYTSTSLASILVISNKDRCTVPLHEYPAAGQAQSRWRWACS